MQRLDIHHHMLPRAWIDEARSHKPDNSWGPRLLNWTPAAAVEQMDRHGIAVAITALGLPGVFWAPPADAARLARLCNEHAAQMNRDFPNRFGMFATIPLPYIDESLAEIAYALDVLQADGIGLLTSYGDRWTGDPAFAPVYEELNRRGAVVHVHPTVPNACVDLIPGIPSSMQEYLFDTARAMTNVLFNGTATRYPKIRWIFSHGGGDFAPLAHRVTSLMSRKLGMEQSALEAQIRSFYFDIATSVSAPTFAALTNLTSFDRILLGTDYPYIDVDETITDFERLELALDKRYAIETGNALALFPRLQSLLAPPVGSA
jgi:predicted TIM-barrel fold metal-dependent hydrolase